RVFLVVGRERDDDRVEAVGPPARLGLGHVRNRGREDAEASRPPHAAQHAEQHLLGLEERPRRGEALEGSRAEERGQGGASANQPSASAGSGVFASARVWPPSRKPPNATRPVPRISMRANCAMSWSTTKPSTRVTLREPSRTTGTISHGSTNWAKLRGSYRVQTPPVQ